MLHDVMHAKFKFHYGVVHLATTKCGQWLCCTAAVQNPGDLPLENEKDRIDNSSGKVIRYTIKIYSEILDGHMC